MLQTLENGPEGRALVIGRHNDAHRVPFQFSHSSVIGQTRGNRTLVRGRAARKRTHAALHA